MVLSKKISFHVIFVVWISTCFQSDSNAQSWDTGDADTPCVTPGGADGACRPLVMCPSLYDLIKTRPISTEVTNLLRNSQCGFINKQPKVCCSLPESSDTPEISPIAQPLNDLIPNPPVCGDSIISRIYGGMETDLDEFPWTALLEYTRPEGKGFYCGGVLISSRYVLTAAHCVNGSAIPSTWRLTGVRLGEWNTKTEIDCSADNEVCADPPVDIPIESTVVHSQYGTNNKSKLNDIALLRLATPVSFTYWVKPVCLPIYDQRLISKNFVGDDLYAVGWGATETKSVSDVKLKVRIPVVPQSNCTPIYAKVGVVVGPHQMCAGGKKGEDTCRGDSGGPLMFADVANGVPSWYVAGITNVGSTPCGTQGWPGVYTRVTSYTKWITDNILP